MTCVNENQFYIEDGVIHPQPWMQLRRVHTKFVEGKSVDYNVSGGGAKNERLHVVQASWTNDTPITQYVYGRVTSGGMEVALQARSRGYFEYLHGYQILSTDDPPAADTFGMDPVNRFGGGADLGRDGLLAVGTGFCIHDVRTPGHTIPFMPHITGWFPVDPGDTFHARVELWFRSEYWENSVIDGGDQQTESYIRHEGTQLDLFAVPGVDPPVRRATPEVIGATWDIDSPDGEAHCNLPDGVEEDDLLVALLFATGGGHSAMTAPAGWTMVSEFDGGNTKLHFKVFTKRATGAEPSSYEFGVPSGIGTEGMIQIIAVRNVDHDEGVDVHLQHTKPTGLLGLGLLGANKVCMLPSIVSYKKLLLAFSGFSHTPLQGQIEQDMAPGLTELTNDEGDLISLAAGYQYNPPNPTGERAFKARETVLFGDGRITGVLLVTGPLV